jgi:Uma2 family endonuclease
MIKTSRKQIRIGPEDDGRRMSLDDFDKAIAAEGYLYELGRGVIEVSNVPQPKHARRLQEIRDQLVAYRIENPDRIYLIGGGAEAKLLIRSFESERHPDLSVYLTPPPEVSDVWSLWVPTIVIEIVSGRSGKRDYEDKPPEYLDFGVAEYWVIDAEKGQMTVLTRWGGQWKKKMVKPPQKYATHHLPGFTLDLKRVLAAGK